MFDGRREAHSNAASAGAAVLLLVAAASVAEQRRSGPSHHQKSNGPVQIECDIRTAAMSFIDDEMRV